VVEHIIHHKNEVQMDRQTYRNLNRWTAVTVNGHKKDEWGCQVITFKKPRPDIEMANALRRKGNGDGGRKSGERCSYPSR